jgi:6-phosphogluconolactonase
VASKPKTIIRENPADLFSWTAGFFAQKSKECVTGRGRFVVALSGGSTPRPVHRLLSQEPYRSEIPWEDIHIFWVDERCVPETSPASNFGTAKEDLLDHVPLSPGQVHPMPGRLPPREGARQYQRELAEFFGGPEGLPVFDLILLGLGEDGHTASLFPGQQALGERKAWIVPVEGGNPNVSRLTMTLPVLNQGKQIVFLVSGSKKAQIVRVLFEEKKKSLPAARIQPVKGELTYFLDRKAAASISRRYTP